MLVEALANGGCDDSQPKNGPQASKARSGHFRLAYLEVQGRASSILPQLKSFADDIGFYH
jgi:hypothetical protein